METLTAARWQMAMSLGFHMIFAAIGIGLPLLLVIVEGIGLRTGRPAYQALARKWAKATGLLFAVGAVSGTALSFELGLLWPKYMEVTGAVVGPMFALEGFAFFIEAIFIGLYLYGWEKLAGWRHWWCGVVVAVSGAASGVLILGVNSWMQLPVGFVVDGGKVIVTDSLAIYKQYGWVVMAIHSTLACYAAVAFAVSGIYALGLVRGRCDAYHTAAVRVALAVGAVSAVLQPFSGDFLAKFVVGTQKAKFAAMEGQFKTEAYAPLRIGGWPNVEKERTEYAIEIPGGLSFLAANRRDAVVPGLDSVPRRDWPNVHLTHAMFQAMVACGMAMIGVSIVFWILAWIGGEWPLGRDWLMWAVVACGPLGFVALEAGWIVTEVGRQPWVIQPGAHYAGMRTAEAVTGASGVLPVFVGFVGLYLLLAITVVVLLFKLRAPQETDHV